MADDFLFDTLMQFFRSPMWAYPINNFIDQYSIAFDDSKENKVEHTQIHQSFQSLMDDLLTGQLSELGVSGEDFMKACESGSNKELHNLVTEYILAMDDFATFKKMMQKRNIELELEALHLLRSGGVEALVGSEDPDAAAADELQMLQAAITASIADLDLLSKQKEMETVQLEHALAMSLALEEERVRVEKERFAQQKASETEKKKAEELHTKNVAEIKTDYETQKKAQETNYAAAEASPELTKKAVEASLQETKQKVKREKEKKSPAPDTSSTLSTNLLGPLKKSGGAAFAQKPLLAGATGGVKIPDAPPKPTSGSKEDDELKKREEFLKSQRDKLVETKKKHRDQEIKEFSESQGKPATPSKPQLDDQHLQMRLALARRCKEDLLNEAKLASARK